MSREGTYAKWNDNGYRYAKDIIPIITARAVTVVRMYAELIHHHALAQMRLPKSGRKYVRPGGRIHIASAPGEAPAIDFGKLSKDWRIKYAFGGLQATIFTDNTGYARFLEEGTKNMAARPYAKPAFDAYQEAFRQQLRASIATI